MNIGNLKNLKLENLREFSPLTYQQLQESGKFDEYLDSVSRAAQRELDSLVNSGYSTDQAWEVVRAEFLRPVDDPLSDWDDEDEGPNAGILSALNETVDIQNRSWEELAEVPPQSEEDLEKYGRPENLA